MSRNTRCAPVLTRATMHRAFHGETILRENQIRDPRLATQRLAQRGPAGMFPPGLPGGGQDSPCAGPPCGSCLMELSVGLPDMEKVLFEQPNPNLAFAIEKA